MIAPNPGSGGFGGAASLGGAVVTLRGDLSPLQGTLAQARSLVAQFESKPVLLKFAIDQQTLNALRGQITQLASNLQTAAVVRMTVDFQPLKVRADFGSMMQSLQASANANPLRIPIQFNGGGAGGGTSNVVNNVSNVVNNTTNAGGGGGSGGGGAGGSGLGFSTRGLGRLFSVFAVAEGLGGIFQGGAEGERTQAQINRNPAAAFNMSGSQLALTKAAGGNSTSGIGNQGFAQFKDTSGWGQPVYAFTQSLPLIGPVLRGIADQVAAGPLADAARLDFQNDRLQVRMERGKALSRGSHESAEELRTRTAEEFADDDQRILMQSTERRRRFEKRRSEATPAERKYFDDEATALTQAEAADQIRAQDATGRINRGFGARVVGSTLRIQAANALRAGTGGDLAAMLLGRDEGRLGIVSRQENELDEEKNPARRRQLLDAQKQEREAFDAETLQQREDHERRSQDRIVAVQAQGNAAILRATKDFRGAEIAEFNAMAAGKLAAVRTGTAAEQQAVARSLQQEGQALASRQSEEQQLTLMGFRAGGNAAALHAGHFGLSADLQGFDAQTAELRSRVNTADRPAFDQSRAGQRAGLVVGYGQNLANTSQTLAAQTAASQALIADNPLAAQVLLAANQSRLAVLNSDPVLRDQMKETQIASLQAMRHELLGVRGGGIAVSAAAGDLVGDPLDLAGAVIDRRKAARKLDEAEKEIGGMEGSPAGSADATNKLIDESNKLLNQILAKINPYAFAAP